MNTSHRLLALSLTALVFASSCGSQTATPLSSVPVGSTTAESVSEPLTARYDGLPDSLAKQPVASVQQPPAGSQVAVPDELPESSPSEVDSTTDKSMVSAQVSTVEHQDDHASDHHEHTGDHNDDNTHDHDADADDHTRAPVPSNRPEIQADTPPVTGTYLAVPDDSMLGAGHSSDSHDEHAHEIERYVIATAEGKVVDAPASESIEPMSTVTLSNGQLTEVPVAAAGERVLREVGNSPRQRRVHVIGIVPQGMSAVNLPDINTSAQLINNEVNSFWSSQTNNQVSFKTISITKWTTSPYSCSQPSQLWSHAAEITGYRPNTGEHLAVIIPRNGYSSAGCSYGLGQQANLNFGGMTYSVAGDWTVIAHELGHNLGLGHSNGYTCSDRLADRNCTFRDYDSNWDIMGISGGYIASLSTPQLFKMAALGNNILDVNESGRYYLDPVASRIGANFGSGNSGLRVTDPAGGGSYYVEYRNKTYRDNSDRVTSGVYIYRDISLGNSQSAVFKTVFTPGDTFVTQSGRTKIAVESIDGQAVVNVTVDNKPAPQINYKKLTMGTPSQAVPNSGIYQFNGQAWAHEGTINWTAKEVNGGRSLVGHATTQRGDETGRYSFWLELPVGAWDITASLPNDADENESTYRESVTARVTSR